MVNPEDSGGSPSDGKQLTRTSSRTHFTRQAATRSGIRPRNLPSASRPVVSKPKKVNPKEQEEMDDDGNDPVTRHEDESCASSQKDDGNQQEEAGTHPRQAPRVRKNQAPRGSLALPPLPQARARTLWTCKSNSSRLSLPCGLSRTLRSSWKISKHVSRIWKPNKARQSANPNKNRFDPGW